MHLLVQHFKNIFKSNQLSTFFVTVTHRDLLDLKYLFIKSFDIDVDIPVEEDYKLENLGK